MSGRCSLGMLEGFGWLGASQRDEEESRRQLVSNPHLASRRAYLRPVEQVFLRPGVAMAGRRSKSPSNTMSPRGMTVEEQMADRDKINAPIGIDPYAESVVSMMSSSRSAATWTQTLRATPRERLQIA